MGRTSGAKEERKLQRIEDTLFGAEQLYAGDSNRAVSDLAACWRACGW